MAKSTSGRGGHSREDADPMAEATRDRLDHLDARIEEARGKHPKADAQTQNARGAAMGMAMRLGIELVAGTVVGGFIGWWLDKWLGTTPFLLLLFFFLGTAAGILNVVRTAYDIQTNPDKDAPPG